MMDEVSRPMSGSMDKRKFYAAGKQMGRSKTAFELRHSHKHLNHTTITTTYAMRQKFFNLNIGGASGASGSGSGAGHSATANSNSSALTRPKSSINHMKRSYTTIIARSASRRSVRYGGDMDEGKQTPSDLEDDDTSNPKRSFFTMIRMNMVFFAISILFSFETALAVPILLKLKVPEQIYSLVYLFSPLLGFLFQPVLGVMSDRCESKFGRRRPFILILSVGAFIGITLILNGYLFGQLLGDKNLKTPFISISLVGLGVTFLDFSADSTDMPLRALILDVCNSKDQDTALNINAFIGGIGASFGYLLAAFDWNKTFLRVLGDELQLLYYIAALIFIGSLIMTLTSVRETPIILIKERERLPLIESERNLLKLPDDIFERDEETANDNDTESETSEDDDQPVSLKMLFQSIKKMPSELIRLLVCQFVGWSSYFSIALFLTDFVGQSIYHGDPAAPTNSTKFEDYNHGVRMGCWCLVCYSVTSALYAIMLENFLMNKFTTRTLYFFSYFVYSICMGLIYFQTSIYVIMPLCSSIGMILTSLTTLPYQMISEFHQDKAYRSQSAPGTKRGLGIDCSLLGSVYFLSQTFVSGFMSVLIWLFGNYVTVVIASLFGLTCCFLLALFVIYPKSENQK